MLCLGQMQHKIQNMLEPWVAAMNTLEEKVPAEPFAKEEAPLIQSVASAVAVAVAVVVVHHTVVGIAVPTFASATAWAPVQLSAWASA